MVAAAAGLVLLVACANVANLTLVRADAHQRELAVREALGAGRTRLMLHFFAEAVVVTAGVASVLGIAAATVAVRALVAAGPARVPRLDEVTIDSTTVLFTIVLAILVAFACSVIPALRAGGGTPALRDGGRSGTAGRVQHRLRGGLVAAQMAFGLVVLAASGLLLRTVLSACTRCARDSKRSTSRHFGSRSHLADTSTDTSVVRFYFAAIVARDAALPGVSTVGLTTRLPLETHGRDPNPIYPEGDESYANTLPPLQLLTAINRDYFRAMSIPVLAGKTFEQTEAQAAGVAIVSRSTAQFFWKDSTGVAAIGKRFRPLPTSPWYTVIGVVGDTRDSSLAAPPSQVVYFPETLEDGGALAQTKRTMALVLRTSGEQPSLAQAVQRAVRDGDPSLPTFDARPMSAVLRTATAQLSFIILILGAAAAVTLLLGAVGLYGVLAYVVTLRTRELGIRIALGATPRLVAAAMTRYGLVLTCAPGSPAAVQALSRSSRGSCARCSSA